MSFKNVGQSDDYVFYGKKKNNDKAVIFASVATLGRAEYLNEEYFPKDYFDYIVIDKHDIERPDYCGVTLRLRWSVFGFISETLKR